MEAEKVIIRSYPKVIYFYPTFLLAIATTLFSLFTGRDPGNLCGWIFCVTFAFNMLVFSTDFTKSYFLNLVMVLIALTSLLALLNMHYNVIGPVSELFKSIKITMNRGFYGFMVMLFGAMYLGIVLSTRFEYWELTSNELIHYNGFLSDTKRYSAPSMKYEKITVDMLEMFLAGAGNLKVHPTSEKEPLIIENVPFVNSKFKKMDHILSHTEVTLSRHEGDDQAKKTDQPV